MITFAAELHHIIMKHIYFLLALVPAYFMSYSQNEDIINDADQLKKYLAQSKFEIDSAAQAVILYEKGTALNNSTVLNYTVERTIKIIGKEALEAATVIVSINEYSSVKNIKGITYNLAGDEISTQEIQKSEIIKEKVNDHLYAAKFNLPSVKEGSIIHYSYTIETPTSFFVPDWYLQGKYPKLYSEYEIVVPSYIVFTSIERTGNVSKKVTKRSELKDCDACFFSTEIHSSGTNNVWVRKNIPAYKEEPYMLAKDNYIERIKVHVTATSSNGYTFPVLKNWDQLNEDVFYKDDLYTQVFSVNGFLKDETEEIIRDKHTDLDKAKAIFRYVRDNINYKLSGKFEAGHIKDVLQKKEGNLHGVNLLLTAMLRKAGLNSEPLLVATKNEECLNSLFADPGNINYLVSLLKIDGKTYFLDATEKHIPFDLLPLECYNGLAITVNKKESFAYLNPDSLRDRSFTLVNVTPSEKNPGKMNIKATYNLGRITSYNLRNEWHNDTTLALNKIEKEWAIGHDLTIISRSVQNLKNPDSTLKITIEAEMDISNNDLVYWDPYFDKFFQKNPFPSLDRMFPVTMDYRRDATYVLTLQLPNGYTLDDYPKSTVVKLDDSGVMELQNIARYDKEKNQLRIQNHLAANTTAFPVEVYNQLREFYDHVIDEQNKKVVIKKNN